MRASMTGPAIPKLLVLPVLTVSCRSTHCERAHLVLTTAHASANALLKAYELARLQRGRPKGMTTDNEQDLLRSMLVMSAAGLDATAKQLVQDGLPALLAIDEKARNSFEKFVARRLSFEPPAGSAAAIKLLAATLTSPSPQRRLIEEYVDHLTGGSLQSATSLFEVAAALGAEPSSIGLVPNELQPVFETRNMIIHELDINLNSRTRTRNVRSQGQMIANTNRLFRLAVKLFESVDARLPPKAPKAKATK